MTRPDSTSNPDTPFGQSSFGSFRRESESDVFGEATIGPGSNVRSSAASMSDRQPATRENSRTVLDAQPMAPSTSYPGGLKFQASDELGRGGWGIVQRARDQTLDREVAIKRIIGETHDQELRDQFLHEAQITGRLQHPGVVPVHELGQEQTGEMFYVMKLLEGDTLRAHIRATHQHWSGLPRRSQPMLDELLAPLLERFIDICNTIAYAHQKGVIHRDLKPANIMVGEFGETIVLDWGLAKTIDDAPEDCSETLRHGFGASETTSDQETRRRSERHGVVIGTPAYMSPEQAQGRTPQLDHRSDIFSLGVILYEILSGQHPHKGLKTDEVLERAKAAEFESLKHFRPGLSPAMVAVVEKSMALQPRDRYDSALDLANDVRHWMLGEPVSVHPGTLLERCGRWGRRHRTLAAAILSSAAILLVSASAFSLIIHKAHRAERKARQAAEVANRSALKRLIEARDATDTWLLDLSGTLQFYPGLQSERDKLIQKAIDQYATLAAQQSLHQTMRSTEPLEKIERGKCYLRLGDLYRLTGNVDLARSNYDAAHQVLMSINLAEEPPQHSEPQVNLVSANFGDARMDAEPVDLQQQIQLELAQCVIGRILSGGNWSSDASARQQLLHANQSLATLLPRVTSTTNATTIQMRAASAKLRLDLAMAGQSDRSAADRIESAKSAVDWAAWLVSRRGTSQDQTYQITAFESLATLYDETGATTESLRVWSELSNLLDQQKSEDTVPLINVLQSSAHAKIQFAKQSLRIGDRASAITGYRQAIEDLNEAWQSADPDDFYRTNLATAEFNLAEVYAADPEQKATAQSLLQRSSQTYQELLRQQPTVDVLHRLTEANASLADITRGTDEEASHLDDAIAGFELLDDHAELTQQERLRWLSLLVRRLNLRANGQTADNPYKLLHLIGELTDTLGNQAIPQDLQSEIEALQKEPAQPQ
ncbi:serine/threonine-protein kinase [Rhodopirellula sp. MGV]|uniref:serine/threonine-protein kinase n=1 Tax=Rhodopirellula sp. MGV TaxID=2023130 RepID=UPI00117A2831|nr:serine/threonine-protein kinase [Rhodopirellula sp. MGV]